MYFKQIFLLCLFVSQIIYSQNKQQDKMIHKKAKVIHQNVITIDTHDDINIANFTKDVNYSQDLSSQVNLPKMNKGGLDVAWFIVYTGQDTLSESGYKKAYNNAISKFEAIHNLVENIAPNAIELALNSKDVKRIHASGKKVAMIGVENAYPIGMDLSNIEKFYKLGARYMSLAHQGHSQFSDSNTGEKDNKWLYDDGLSDLGKQAVKEMNRLGIMIDVSHPSKGAFMDMIQLSKAPLIASHSSSRKICNHSRNLDDEQLLLLKENDGVVQTVAFAGYVNIEKNAAYQQSKKDILSKIAGKKDFKILNRKEISTLNMKELSEYNLKFNKIKKEAKSLIKLAEKNTPPVDVSDFVDHIDYMVKLIGVDHVGISSDFDGGGGVKGWNDASETYNVTFELVKRGYSENEIAKLWGLNLLRVMDKVQKIASGM
ncbi:MAG: dipeptidase [Flavobacteriaceae bacterium]|nr:dipeptidase [Flavobacteriaceae bacterium]